MEKLKIYTFVDGTNDIPFYDEEHHIELTSYEADLELMGTFSITGKIHYPKCLDSYWNGLQYVTFRDERYFIRNTPSSEYSNESVMYIHTVELISEKDIKLGGKYFIDAVTDDTTVNSYRSNSTDVTFFGDLGELVSRLNSAAGYAGLGYTFVVDEGVTSEAQPVSFTDKYFLDVLKESYDIFGVPFYFIGKVCHFGPTNNVISSPFRYGAKNELLKISKQNAGKQIVRSATGEGSSDNIPYYYPNNSPKGNIDVSVPDTNDSLAKEGIVIRNYEKFANGVGFGDRVVYSGGGMFGPSQTYRNGRIYYGTDVEVRLSETGKVQRDTYYFDFTVVNSGTMEIEPTMTRSVYGVESTLNPAKSGIVASYNLRNQDIGLYLPVSLKDGLFITPYLQKGVTYRLILYYELRHIGVNNYTYKTHFTGNGIPFWNLTSEDDGEDEGGGGEIFSAFQETLSNHPYSGGNFVQSFVPGNDTHLSHQIRFTVNGQYSLGMSFDMKLDGVAFDLDSDIVEEMTLTRVSDGYSIRITKESSTRITTAYLQPYTEYLMNLTYFIKNTGEPTFTIRSSIDISMEGKAESITDKGISLDSIGIEIAGNVSNGDYFTQVLLGKTPVASVLMPPIYRETSGGQRFYRAENDTYKKKDSEEYYSFENEYIAMIPSEGKITEDGIKPTIRGIKNAAGQPINMFLDVAFDDNDNDEQDEDGNYIHPYFFVKLPKFDGDYEFNLFDSASESGEMTFSMTSGTCGGCSFILGVDEETSRNIVQVDDNGNLKRDSDGNVLWSGQQSQDRQNDTRNYEVWVALKKEYSTFGVVMPNATNNYRPKAGDTFVLLNILLPQAYILNAENELKYAILDYMKDNNVDKFNFSIDFSRIYIEENSGIDEEIRENTLIYVEYGGATYEFHVQSYAYSVSNDSPLPEIKVTLTKEVASRVPFRSKYATQNEVRTIVSKSISAQPSASFAASRKQNGPALVAEKVSKPLIIVQGGRTTRYNGSTQQQIDLSNIEGDFVTLDTTQTITGKKTFAEDAVFGADGSRLFIPSGDTPGTYDIFIDPGMAVEGEEPTGGSGGGSGEWETWEDAAGTDVPVGFHRVTSTFPTSFIKGHIYFFTDTRQLALATGTSSASLSYYSSLVSNVSYSAVSKTLTITPAGEHRSPVTIDLSSFAEKAQLGDLSDLTTTAKSDLVSAINEVLAAVEAGGSGSKVTVDREAFPPQEGGGILVAYTIKQGGKTVGVINIPKDMVVSSGTVETNPYGQPSGTYLVLTLANATSDKVYINVGSLVDIYTAAKNAAQVQLSINSATREISATIVAGSITTTELASKCVTGAKIADDAVNTSHISNGAVSILKLDSSLQKILNNALSASDITTGKNNGSIAVEGKDVPVRGLGSAAYKDEGYFVTVGTAQTITGKKTFAEDAVFGADGSRLFIPSGDTPGTYDIFVDPGMAVEGEEPTGGSGSGTWETWEDAAGTDVPVGFHLLTSLTGQTFNKGHIYFNKETGIPYVALRSGSDVISLQPFAGRVASVSYSATGKTLTVRYISGISETIDLSDLSGQPLWSGRVSSAGVATRNSGTSTITVNRSNEGVYGIKGVPAGRTVVVSPLDYFAGSATFVKAPHISVVSQSSRGILTVRMYTLDGTLDDFGFSLMIM